MNNQSSKQKYENDGVNNSLIERNEKRPSHLQEIGDDFFKTSFNSVSSLVTGEISNNSTEPNPLVTTCKEAKPVLSIINHLNANVKLADTLTSPNCGYKNPHLKKVRSCFFGRTNAQKSTSLEKLNKSFHTSTQTSELLTYIVNTYTSQLEKLLELKPKTNMSNKYMETLDDSANDASNYILTMTVYTQTANKQLYSSYKVIVPRKRDTFCQLTYKRISSASTTKLSSAYDSVKRIGLYKTLAIALIVGTNILMFISNL